MAKLKEKDVFEISSDSDHILRVDSIADSLKIVDSAVSEKILLFEKKFGSSLTAICKPTRVVYKIFSKIEIVDPLFPLLTYLLHFAEKAPFLNKKSYK